MSAASRSSGRSRGGSSRWRHRGTLGALLVALAVFVLASPARAWILHEHTRIGRLAVEGLPSADRAQLVELWKDLRRSDERLEGRLCKDMALSSSERVLRYPTAFCVDLGLLPSIAADFACSPEELYEEIAGAAWVKEVVQAGEQAEDAILRAGDDADIVSVWHDNHIQNFRKDPHYLARADGNESHFLLLRSPEDQRDLARYLGRALRELATPPGAAAASPQPPNGLAWYVLHHVAALRLADKALGAGGAARATLLRRALFAESFALHYLQDAFSSGHTVGAHGGSRERVGTHDMYCETGLEAHPWDDPPPNVTAYHAHGDAFLADVDARHAASAVASSLSDFLSVLRDGVPASRHEVASEALSYLTHAGSKPLDACLQKSVPPGLAPLAGDVPILWTLWHTYMPVLEVPDTSSALLDRFERLRPADVRTRAAIPRFRSELGPFLGLFAGAAYAGGAPVRAATSAHFFGVMDLGLSVGVGLEAIATARSDALFVFQGGAFLESQHAQAPFVGDASEPRVPDRAGFVLRARVPFYAFPGDSLLTLPFVGLEEDWARGWLVRASESGSLGLGAVHFTRAGSFQLVLGREVALRGVLGSGGTDPYLLDLPVVEWRPSRQFSGLVAHVLTAQVGLSMEIGDRVSALGGYLRLSENTRYYLTR